MGRALGRIRLGPAAGVNAPRGVAARRRGRGAERNSKLRGWARCGFQLRTFLRPSTSVALSMVFFSFEKGEEFPDPAQIRLEFRIRV
jgi:hypothetical protein